MSLISDNGGWLPNGLLPAIVIIQGVVFAYASIELIGTTAGETENPEKVMPKAINTVIIRIGIFYVGSVLLLVLLLPYTAYQAGECRRSSRSSARSASTASDVIMNLVVLTAALSSLNAGPVLHRPDPALDGLNGSRPEVRGPDEQGRRALRRHRDDRRRDPARRRPERGRAGGGLRDRAQRGLAGHHRGLGHDRPVPDQAQAVGRSGAAQAPVLPDDRRARTRPT